MAGLISKDEIIKLSEMKQDEVNISAAQMFVLANNIVSGKEDMKSIISSLEKQAWYKRMWNSLNGKMKGTSEEFEQYKGLIALYAVQAVSVLFKSDKFDMDMNMAIRQKIIDIYYFTTLSDAEKLISLEILSELRSGLRELAEKLIENAEQTDAVSIITKGMIRNEFNFNNPIVSACVVLSKLDSSILNSEQALDIIRNSISENELFETAEKSISDYMSDVINIPAEKTGVVYLELASMIDNPWATMFSDLIESYNMFPKMERMAKKKDVIIKNIIEKNDLDSDIAFAASDLFEAMFNTKIEMASMTKNVNIYSKSESNCVTDKNEKKICRLTLDELNESLKREKKYGVDYGYDDVFYLHPIIKLENVLKNSKDPTYIKFSLPIIDYSTSVFPRRTGRSFLKIVYDNDMDIKAGKTQENIYSGHYLIPDSKSGGYYSNQYTSQVSSLCYQDYRGGLILEVYIHRDKLKKLESIWRSVDINNHKSDKLKYTAFCLTLEDLHSLFLDYDIIITYHYTYSYMNNCFVGRTTFGDIVIISREELSKGMKQYCGWPSMYHAEDIQKDIASILNRNVEQCSFDLKLREDLNITEHQMYQICDSAECRFDSYSLKLDVSDDDFDKLETVMDLVCYIQNGINRSDYAKIMPEYHADIKIFTPETKPQVESISQKVEETINPAFSTDIENTEDSEDDNEVLTLSTTETDSLEGDEDDDDDDSEIEEFVIEAICSYLGIDYLDLDIDADLNEDMGVDILDLIDVIEEIEEEFYIDEIDANDLLELRTVRDIIELVKEYYY